MTRQNLIRLILIKLRSGNYWEIQDGERILMLEAGVLSSGCSCPDFPVTRSRQCRAHTFITQSVVESTKHSIGLLFQAERQAANERKSPSLAEKEKP